MAKDKMILLDTNIFIHYFNGEQKAKKAFDSIGAEHIALSIITFAEIIYGTKKSQLSVIQKFLEQFQIFEVDAETSQVFKGIVLNYSFNHHIKIPDAFIAACALRNQLPLYTENKKDFDFITDIKLYLPKF